MKNILEQLRKEVERELNTPNCVIDIFKIQNFEKLRNIDGKYYHNSINITISDTSLVSMRDDFTCVGCGMRAGFVVIAKNIHTNHSTKKYIPFYYIVDTKEGIFKKLTKDHIVPKSLGGANNMKNYQCMCEVCNGKKASLIYGLDVEKLISDRIEDERSRIGVLLNDEFIKAPFLVKAFGLAKYVNKILDKLFIK